MFYCFNIWPSSNLSVLLKYKIGLESATCFNRFTTTWNRLTWMYTVMSSTVGFNRAFKPIADIFVNLGTIVILPWYFCLKIFEISWPNILGNKPKRDKFNALLRISHSSIWNIFQYVVCTLGWWALFNKLIISWRVWHAFSHNHHVDKVMNEKQKDL